jgi:hypothetical protein
MQPTGIVSVGVPLRTIFAVKMGMRDQVGPSRYDESSSDKEN